MVRFLGVALIVVGLLMVNVSMHAQSHGRWKTTMCFTNNCIAETLNALSPEKAAEAKLTTWHNNTYVWYRE